jgi:hypothetical protein
MQTSDNHRAPLSRFNWRLVSPATLFDNWVLAETEAGLALTAWRDARPSVRAAAHASYAAALDREARAAEILAARLNVA